MQTSAVQPPSIVKLSKPFAPRLAYQQVFLHLAQSRLSNSLVKAPGD